MGDPAEQCAECGRRAVVFLADKRLCGVCFGGRASESTPRRRNPSQQTTYVEVVHAFFRLADAVAAQTVSADITSALHDLQRALHRHGVSIL